MKIIEKEGRRTVKRAMFLSLGFGLATLHSLIAPLSADALPYYGEVKGSVSAKSNFTGGSNEWNEQVFSPGPTASGSISASSSRTYESYETNPPTMKTVTGSASAQGSGSAAAGSIGATATLSADSSGPMSLLQAHVASASISAYWYDTITITSTSLATGTPVSLRYSLSLDSSVAVGDDSYGGAIASLFYYGQASPLGLSIADSHLVDPVSRFLTQTVTGYVGDTFLLAHGLNIMGQVSVNTGTGSSSFANILAGNTSHAFVDPLGDFSIESASGHNYANGSASAAPVPEPGTWMLLGSGLSGLAAFRKRFVRK